MTFKKIKHNNHRQNNIHFEVCAGFMELKRLVVLVHADQDTQTAHRDPFLHTEELELITVLPALQRQRIPRHLHKCVLPQSGPLLVQQGVSLAQ